MEARTWARPVAVALLVAAATVPGLQGGWIVRYGACEAVPSAEQLGASLFNVRHVLTYGVLGSLVVLGWPHRRLLALGGVMAFSGAMELQQALFGVGHCRLWDLLPNALGLLLGWALVNRHLRVASRVVRGQDRERGLDPDQRRAGS